MRRFLAAVGSITLILSAQGALAERLTAAVIAKRQLSECMTRRMSADRNLSYNDARRVCKERLQPPKDTLASINPVDTAKAH
ncbi:MAG TPA: hypothetical protein VHS76_00940 [Steroidobacteraceae bacterium]|jgi:hypothetical protein|nr:hypothetical protein [Steroidobacteraceae bacterium]